MRKKIAEHMTFSKQTSAHVTSVYEIDMTNIAKFRKKHQDEFQSRYGTKLTYMPFIFQAVIAAIRKFPIVNSQVDGENIVYKGDINLGMAVALDWGLIVPVIKKADALSLSGLALAANDLADRARMKKLNPDEVQGGTFTITNPVCSAVCLEHRSSTSHRSRSCASARSRSDRRSSLHPKATTTSPSATWRTSR
jgi:2-oxoglutarate dehydrogenase E2 component (dihydrolipoamide succinyltransferase)